MPELFDTLNAWLIHHPALLAQLRWLFWFKSMALFALMGWFLWLVYTEERQPPKRRRDYSGVWRA
jgi:hypothetical protein